MVKPLDAWWTVLFVDPIATRVVPGLARRSWVSPTRITVLAHLLGVASAALFATGHLGWAALVFEVRFVLDCIDGKLARATGRSSVFGQLLDAFGDRVLVMANVVALGWSRSPAAVVLLVASYPLQFHLFESREQLLAERGEAKASTRLMARGWGAALARRRLYPMPISVDVEHLLLVVAPLVWVAGADLVTPALWVTTAYFLLQCLRYGLGLLRTAAALDRAAVSGGG